MVPSPSWGLMSLLSPQSCCVGMWTFPDEVSQMHFCKTKVTPRGRGMTSRRRPWKLRSQDPLEPRHITGTGRRDQVPGLPSVGRTW